MRLGRGRIIARDSRDGPAIADLPHGSHCLPVDILPLADWICEGSYLTPQDAFERHTTRGDLHAHLGGVAQAGKDRMMHRMRAKRHKGIRQQVIGLIPAKRQRTRIVAGLSSGASRAARVARGSFLVSLTALAKRSASRSADEAHAGPPAASGRCVSRRSPLSHVHRGPSPRPHTTRSAGVIP